MGKERVNFTDSVNAFIKMSEEQQLEASALRIRKAGVANELTRIQLAFIEMQAAIIHESKDRDGYNAAVEDFNRSKKIFNDFVQYRNNQFTPLMPDNKLGLLLAPIDSLLLSAVIKLDIVDKSPVNVQYDTGSLRAEMDHFKLKLKEQDDFLQRYLSTAFVERKKLFYVN